MSLALYQQDQVRETEQGVEEEENTIGEETSPVKVCNPNPVPVWYRYSVFW